MSAAAAVRAKSLERDNLALQYRIKGKTLQWIADELGYSSRGAVAVQITRRLRERQEELAATADHHLAQILAELDALTVEAWKVLEKHHVMVSDGRVVRDEKLGTIEDTGPVLAAIDRLARITTQRAKLLGLDKQIVQAEHRVTIEGLSEEELP